eukprot:3701753-Alexandrium_andersonii.AAC.1
MLAQEQVRGNNCKRRVGDQDGWPIVPTLWNHWLAMVMHQVGAIGLVLLQQRCMVDETTTEGVGGMHPAK